MKYVDRAVGIDLGTTNSEVALLDPSERDIVIHADRFGRRTVPSAVAWDAASDRFVVGRAARQRRGQASPPIESIKRKMGQSTTVNVGPHALTPEQVSAKILGELRERMRADLAARAPADLEVRVDRAVITVPAYFDAPQIAATREAGVLAGLEVLGVLQEPTAAAIYHTWKGELGDGVFLVYDLGGGTFDVSILRSLAGEYQVLAIDGDNYLGGDDLDRRFAERLRTMLGKRGYVLEKEDARRRERLVHLAQEVKESLSTDEVVHLSREDIFEDDGGEKVSIDLEIGRAEWESCVADLIETTIACCERALARSQEVASVGVGDVDRVILVGGSTRTPLVVKRVREAICARTKSPDVAQSEVDTCVALGAAVHAAQLGGFRIGDDAGRVRFTSPLVTRTAELRLGIVVEAPDDARSVAVLAEGREILTAEVTPNAERPARLTIPMGEGEERALVLSIRDAAGVEKASLPFSAYRGDVRPRASSLSQPAVVAKDLSIEVMRGGRRERKIIVPRGASVPLEAKHELATGDKSGAVVLRILSNRLPIETLVLEVPTDLPVGTPVELIVKCDAAMRLEARAVVAGRELWASIEPTQHVPASVEEVEMLLAEVETVERRLWGRDAQTFRRVVTPLVAGLREVASTDPDKRATLVAQVRFAIDEFRGESADALSPPLHRFEESLDALRRIVFASETALLGKPTEHWEARIAELDTRGRTAWDAVDEGGWRRATNEAQALYETASTQTMSTRRTDDPAYLSLRTAGSRAWADRLLRGLGDFVGSTSPEVRALQEKERDVLRAAVADAIERLAAGTEGKEPPDVRRALDQCAADLDRIEKGLERLPGLGMVTEKR
jgi:molecular chaperone DnaK